MKALNTKFWLVFGVFIGIRLLLPIGMGIAVFLEERADVRFPTVDIFERWLTLVVIVLLGCSYSLALSWITWLIAGGEIGEDNETVKCLLLLLFCTLFLSSGIWTGIGHMVAVAYAGFETSTVLTGLLCTRVHKPSKEESSQ